MKASRTPVLVVTTVAGSLTRASGAGCSHGTDVSPGATATRWSSAGGPSPDGSGRRARLSMAVRHAMVAILYSHRRSDDRPSNRS
jgi:hypothetical protein